MLEEHEGVWATSELVGRDVYLLLAPQLAVMDCMFKGNVLSTYHVTDITWSKWVALIMQRVLMGTPTTQES